MNYDSYVNKVFDDFNKEIDGINYDEYYFNIDNVVSSLKYLPDNDFENVIEIIINRLFQMILKSNNAKKYKRYDDLWVDMQYRFTDINTKNDIWEQADCISDDIVKKLLGENGRKIEIPIKIKYIKEYSIVSSFNDVDIKTMELYMVLQLLVLNHILNNVNL